MSGADVRRLQALGLLLETERVPGRETSLVALCAVGALEGGLSVALDVRPDELLGPLCQRMGGAAQRLRVVEVRAAPAELWVWVEEKEERWLVPDVPALARALNRCYRAAPAVRAIALLGEGDEAYQLWCIPKAALGVLLGEGLLQAENSEELSALLPH
jgi:hypothetical protein